MSLNPSKDFLTRLKQQVSNSSCVYSNTSHETSLNDTSLKIPWWLWLTILSLDAPCVAVLWQALLADSFNLLLKPLHAVLLFATVWLIYVVDRCFDSIVIAKAYTARHGFYKQHLQRFSILIASVGCLVLVTVAVWLEPTIILHGSILSGVVLLYLANLHLLKKPILLIPKELQIAFVFAAGTSITFWSQLTVLTTSQSILFLSTTLCFAILCFLNCSFISLWEQSVDVLHQQPSLARNNMATKKLAYILQAMVIGLVLVCLFLPMNLGLKSSFVLSSVGLWFLHYSQVNTSVQLRRVLADVVLMSPLLILFLQ